MSAASSNCFLARHSSFLIRIERLRVLHRHVGVPNSICRVCWISEMNPVERGLALGWSPTESQRYFLFIWGVLEDQYRNAWPWSRSKSLEGVLLSARAAFPVTWANFWTTKVSFRGKKHKQKKLRKTLEAFRCFVASSLAAEVFNLELKWWDGDTAPGQQRIDSNLTRGRFVWTLKSKCFWGVLLVLFLFSFGC